MADPTTGRTSGLRRWIGIVAFSWILLLEGTGRVRVGGEDPLTIEPLDSLLIGPNTIRQIFNDTGADALWLVVGAPPEAANTLEMSAEQLEELYPDGPKALPPELA